jgi:hypothetical protein
MVNREGDGRIAVEILDGALPEYTFQLLKWSFLEIEKGILTMTIVILLA